jgi:transcriptional regulator with XRE-family HTH domain
VSFGATLKAWRDAADLSLRELARKVDIEFTKLSKIETGALGPPSDDQIRALAMALGRSEADIDELLTLARQTNIPQAEVRSVLIQSPEVVGALLRRIQRRPLSPEEAAYIRRIAADEPLPREDESGAAAG